MANEPETNFQVYIDEMIANGYAVTEELCERALTSTVEPFHIHVYSWIAQDDAESFHVKVAGYWHVAEELGLVKHDFGEEMPGWKSAAHASTDCTTDVSGAAPDGDADAGTQ